MYEQKDIVLMPFPYTDLTSYKIRPALIISPVEYNKKIGLVLACPITSISKRYPHEARIAETKIKGVVLSDQVRSIDWKARKAEFAESVPSTVIDDVEAKLLTLIQS